jgi:protease I
MNTKTDGKKVAILVADGFEQVEFTKPRQALLKSGAKVKVVSLKPGEIQGMHHDKKGDTFPVDMTARQAEADDFDALLIPGGVMNPDLLRADEEAIRFVQQFFISNKPVFAICHGPQVLITAKVVEGRKMPSYKTIKTDLENAGANWVDESVVVDNGLVTSRNPDDIPDFIEKMLEELAEGKHPENQSATA